MNLKKIILFAVVSIISVAGCKKNNPQPAISKAVDVYAAGTSKTAIGTYVATYWKNGTATKLTDSTSNSWAYSIAVNGNNVYVVGTTMCYNGNMAVTLWKNGVSTKLSDTSVNVGINTSAIAVNGDDVYVATTIVNYKPDNTSFVSAVYWRNNTETYLTDISSPSGANSITINNSNVFVGGYSTDSLGYNEATYWKNGIPTKLSDISTGSDLYDIAVNGSDIYLAGSINGDYTATYWKNNVATAVSDGKSTAIPYAIAISGTDVYMAGITFGMKGFVATLWKNGIALKLTDESAGASWANDVTLNGTDIYVAGDNGYWKNGTFTQLAKTANVYKIQVVTH